VGSERPEVACFARRVPIGVVGMITPWNFPEAIPAWKMFPALVAGNTVVFKPSEETPGVAVAFVQILAQAGVPEGVVNLITGLGSEVGSALVDAPKVGVISFTGSTNTGRKIMERCATQLRRVLCEMGGKNAIIVLDDADLDLAVKGAMWSAFGTTGQRCTAASRLVVHRKVRQEFQERLLREVSELVVGSPSDESVHVGPVINSRQLEQIHGYVKRGIESGATLLCGGTILNSAPYANGCFYAPTVLGSVVNEMEIAQAEIFGPVTVIIEAQDFDDAVRIANGTQYGLSLAMYTRSNSRAFKAMELLDAGLVYVNLPTSGAEIQLPFGGTRNTGNGHREAGFDAADYCTEWKSSYINYSESSELVRAQIDV
jgi:aldehyde dehydrogenase (NAD+)